MESLKIAFDVIVSPFKGFNELKEKKSFWLPFLLTVILSTGVMGYYSFNSDMRYIITKKLEETGKMDVIPQKDREKMLNIQAKAAKYMIPIGSFIGGFIYLLIIALFLYTMAKIYTSDLNFKDALVIVGNSYFVFFIWAIVVIIILMMTDFKTVPINEVVPTNLGFFFTQEQLGKKLYTLFSKLDLFGLWFTYLLGVGFSIFTGESLKKSLLTVFIPYLVFLLIPVLLA